jgi:hypothetical protein
MRRGYLGGWSHGVVDRMPSGKWGVLDMRTLSEFEQLQKDRELREVVGSVSFIEVLIRRFLRLFKSKNNVR